MSFLDSLFGRGPYPADRRDEVEKMIADLTRIGKTEDFLSERPGGTFTAQCRNRQAIEIGKRLHNIGGIELMQFAHKRVRKNLGNELATHLSYSWADIDKWVP